MSAADIPPTNAFWSITLYSDMGFLVENENETYSISSQQSLKYGVNGSLHITISIQPPSEDVPPTNWLPTPQAGEDFQLTFRIYWPTEVVLNYQWTPPVVDKKGGDGKGKKKLSTGAVAGIVIGALFGGMACIGGLFFAYKYAHAKRGDNIFSIVAISNIYI